MDIVIGDVHGCWEQLQDLLSRIGPGSGDRIWSVGDFVDRGPASPTCAEFFMRHHAIMGNHEYKHVRYRSGVLKKLARSQWMAIKQFGGLESPRYTAAVDWMETLPFWVDLGHAIVVHAGLDPSIPMIKQHRITLVGGMSMQHLCGIDPATGMPFWCADYPRTGKPVIFGHLTLQPLIPVSGNLFPVDTGCCAGKRLTAITLPNFRLWSVPGWKRP